MLGISPYAYCSQLFQNYAKHIFRRPSYKLPFETINGMISNRLLNSFKTIVERFLNGLKKEIKNFGMGTEC